jgi:hypothetical protein
VRVAVKWLFTGVAALLVCAFALSTTAASAQEPRDPLVQPPFGAAGTLFQIVGQSGWTPGEPVTIDLAFTDLDPGAQYGGPYYHEREVAVLRDGTWSFPIVVNSDVLPFPLLRPGYIVVRARSGARTAINTFVYIVDGRAPAGAPPLAALGSGPGASVLATAIMTLVLFLAATGGLITLSGTMRRSR